MIGSILVIVFSLASVGVAIAMYKTKFETMDCLGKVSLSFFTVNHLFFLALGISTLFTDLSVTWLIVVSIFIVISRILNGLALYGKNIWSHYIVTMAILLAIIVLHVGNY